MTNTFWIERGKWPLEAFGYVFLGQAVVEIGAAMFADDWTGYEGGTEQPGALPADFVMPDGKRITTPQALASFGSRVTIGNALSAANRWEKPSNNPARWKFTDEEWKEGIALAQEAIAPKLAQIARFKAVTRTLSKAALSGELVTALRPLAGGLVGPPLPIHAWNAENVDHRFHLCQIDPHEPFGRFLSSSRHQYIFVSRESLDALIAKLRPEPEPVMQRKAWQNWFRELVKANPLERVMTAPKIEEYARVNFGVSRAKVEDDRAAILEGFPPETRAVWSGGGSPKGPRKKTTRKGG